MTGLPKQFRWTGIALWVAMMVSVGCTEDYQTVSVDLSRRISTGQETRPPPASGELRVAVAATFSPQESLPYYQNLLDFIGSRIGRSVRVDRRRTYEEVNALLGAGNIDLAFICSGPYVTGKGIFGFRPLAAPFIMSKETYRSYLIVRRDSPIDRLDQLRGKTVAYTDPDSNTGCLLPRYLLFQRGEIDARFFGKTIFTHSHDNSILAVSRNLADGAFVHEQIWEYLHRKKPEYTQGTRVIYRSEPFGNPPVVVSPKLAASVADRIQQLLFSMHTDPDGRRILDRLLVAQFVPVNESLYDPVRRMVSALKKEAADGSGQKP